MRIIKRNAAAFLSILKFDKIFEMETWKETHVLVSLSLLNS